VVNVVIITIIIIIIIIIIVIIIIVIISIIIIIITTTTTIIIIIIIIIITTTTTTTTTSPTLVLSCSRRDASQLIYLYRTFGGPATFSGNTFLNATLVALSSIFQLSFTVNPSLTVSQSNYTGLQVRGEVVVVLPPC
jgi:hypothetical protein